MSLFEMVGVFSTASGYYLLHIGIRCTNRSHNFWRLTLFVSPVLINPDCFLDKASSASSAEVISIISIIMVFLLVSFVLAALWLYKRKTSDSNKKITLHNLRSTCLLSYVNTLPCEIVWLNIHSQRTLILILKKQITRVDGTFLITGLIRINAKRRIIPPCIKRPMFYCFVLWQLLQQLLFHVL